MKNKIAAAVIGLSLALVLGGCGKKNTGTAETGETQAQSDDASEEGTGEEGEDESKAVMTVGLLFPNDQEKKWETDISAITSELEDKGYEVSLCLADDDADTQVSQTASLMEEEDLAAMVIAPIDEYSFTDVLPLTQREESSQTDTEISADPIRVFSYDRLIMDTEYVDYYVTYNTRTMGQSLAQAVVKAAGLDKMTAQDTPLTVEFVMGSVDDVKSLFMYNGFMEVLQPYFDAGVLTCLSGQTTFDQVGTIRFDAEEAADRMEDICTEYYQGGAPDIICCSFDDAACQVVEMLQELGIADTDWPIITGSGCTLDAVRLIKDGYMKFSTYEDRKALGEQCASMIDTLLTGDEKPDVSDYSQYDNGVKIVGTYSCDAKVISADDYEVLIDTGYYTQDEIDGGESSEETAGSAQEDTDQAEE